VKDNGGSWWVGTGRTEIGYTKRLPEHGSDEFIILPPPPSPLEPPKGVTWTETLAEIKSRMGERPDQHVHIWRGWKTEAKQPAQYRDHDRWRQGRYLDNDK
jgi:hypothetical protein